MPRRCSICDHPERSSIDAAIAGNDANRRIATQYGVTEAAVRRHKANHLSAIPAAVQAVPEVRAAVAVAADATIAQAGQSARFMARFEELRGKIDVLLATAEADGDRQTMVAAIREARALLALESTVVLQVLGMAAEKDDTLKIEWRVVS